MHKLCATSLLFLCCYAIAIAQPQPSRTEWLIETESGLVYKDGLIYATNTPPGVTVKYAGAVLKAERATLNRNTGDIVAEGHVYLQFEGQIWMGDSLQYNFHTRKIVGQNFRAGTRSIFSKSQVFVGDQAAGVYVGVNNLVTSDDYAKPSYSIRAKSLVIVPGEYIEARQATLYLGKVPIFYLPYYRRSLKVEGARWEVTPGYRTAFGPFVLNNYYWYQSEALQSSIHLDARQKRGAAGGPDFNWRLKRWGDGAFRGYYAYDLDPGVDNNLKPIDEDRYRIWFAHQATPWTNLNVTAVARYQSDPLIIHDFFEGEYKRNVQPSTFFEADQLWPNYGLDLLVQPRVNDFFETVERLPDVKLSGLRQQIGATPLFYESDSSLGYYQRKFPSGSTNEPFSAFRADTLQQFVLPQTFFNFLNVIPRVGGRFTHYGEATGPGATTTEQERGIFNTGAELTMKASRVWPEVQSKFWELDGIRHIIQPSINYSYVPNPTVTPQKLPQFDYLVPTTRLLPIEFPDFNAIDAIDSENVVRLGLRNKIQTKRKGVVDNVLHWALVTDWRVTRHPGQQDFSDLYSELEFKPFSWLALSSDVRFNMGERHFNEAIHQLAVMPNNRWSLAVGHRYLREDPSLGIFDQDNLLFTTAYYKFNENWGFRLYEQYQARDQTLEEQSYSLYHDFRSWTGALSFRVRDNRGGPMDYTVAVTFSLKAFPRFSVDDDRVRPWLLMGY